jgi:tRNA(fMet)-specific endonuclease VapC
MTKNYLIDTNIVGFYFRDKYDIGSHIKSIGGLGRCAISEITLAELKYGTEKSRHKEQNKKMLVEFCADIEIIPISGALDFFAAEKARLEKMGKRIDDFDLLIGCTAVVNDFALVTDNTAHFERISGIILENWVER